MSTTTRAGTVPTIAPTPSTTSGNQDCNCGKFKLWDNSIEHWGKVLVEGQSREGVKLERE